MHRKGEVIFTRTSARQTTPRQCAELYRVECCGGWKCKNAVPIACSAQSFQSTSEISQKLSVAPACRARACHHIDQDFAQQVGRNTQCWHQHHSLLSLHAVPGAINIQEVAALLRKEQLNSYGILAPPSPSAAAATPAAFTATAGGGAPLPGSSEDVMGEDADGSSGAQ